MISILLADLRQLLYHREFRIPRPAGITFADGRSEIDGLGETHQDQTQQPMKQLKSQSGCCAEDIPGIDAVLSEIAIGLWDIERKLRPEEGRQLDRKQRLLYRRAAKGIDALARARVTIEDPTGKRYVQGSEGSMKPIELQPMAGTTREMVTETVVPIVYRKDRLIRRGEVFVAVPLENSPAEETSQDSSNTSLPVEAPADHPASEKQINSGAVDASGAIKGHGKKKD